MKGLLVVGILAVLVVPLAGCVMPTGAPIMGAIYTDVTGPGYAIDSSASFSKVGTSECSGDHLRCHRQCQCSESRAVRRDYEDPSC